MADLVQSMSEVFSGRLFYIPDYQRGFAWEIKQLDDLLEDLFLLPKEREHFTGTLILRTNGNKKEKTLDIGGDAYASFYVIDGQQRLTSIIILLTVIYNEMRKIESLNMISETLRRKYLCTMNPDEQPLTKMTLNRDCQEYFHNNILELSPDIQGDTIRSHKLLSQAKEHFRKYLVEECQKQGEAYSEWLKELYFKITQGLTAIVYEVSDELDAGVIFETMNDRGKPLTELELVKNYLLYVAAKLNLNEPHGLNEHINKTWAHIFEELMSADLSEVRYEDQLLRVHWLMAYNPNKANWKQNRSIKERFSLRKYKGKHKELLTEIKGYLNTLQDAATAYCDIHRPGRNGAFNDYRAGKNYRRIIEISEKLVRLGPRVTYMPLLIAIRLHGDKQGHNYYQVAELCEKFDFRVYQWLNRRSNTGQSKFFNLGHKFYNFQNEQGTLSQIAGWTHHYCPDERFEERFDLQTENWYQWSGLKYFLYAYEEFLAAVNKKEKPDYKWGELSDVKRDTIEHILPQTPTHYWRMQFNQDPRKRWTHDIGNLTLTYDNSCLGNKPFPEKKGDLTKNCCYASSNLHIERQIAAEYDDWTEEQVIDRREKIRTWALERWYVDPPDHIEEEKVKDLSKEEKVMLRADELGVGEEFRTLHALAVINRLHPVGYEMCIRYAPPANGTLTAFTVYPHEGYLEVDIYAYNFLGFPNMSREAFMQIIGDEEHHVISADETGVFIEKLEKLFAVIEPK
jgi:uncharacterized protein with ParB-like and HNH nuclease domain